jgi:macrolide-specific efflux system membrane fusion protein
MSGTVVSVTARQGQTLNANQQAPTILRIANLSTMTVQTQVSEADVSKLRQGMEVYFTTLGSQGRRWYGSLRKVEPTPTVTNNVVLYNALFDVPNANQSLMTNMTAQVFFIAATAKDTLLIPAAALNSGTRSGDAAGRRERSASEPRREGRAASTPSGPASASTSGFATETPRGTRRATVKLLTAAGTLEDRPVELGVSNRVQTQVLSGLAEGDQVVAGIRLPPAAQRSSSQSQPGGGLQQNPGGMPPGMGGGTRGR